MAQQRVTLICSAFPPETGAAPGRMYHMARLLQAQGFAVTVLTALPNYPAGRIFDAYRGKLSVSEEMEGIRIHRTWLIPSNAKSVWKRFFSSVSYALSLFMLGRNLLRRAQPDLIIVSSPPFITGYCGLRISARINAVKLLNLSDLWPDAMVDLGAIRAGRRFRLLKWLEHAMYRRADAVSAQSAGILETVRPWTQQKPLFLYRNLQAAAPEASQPRPDIKRRLVYAGLLGVAQGLLELCRSIDFAALQTELHVYGEGFEKEALLDFIAAHPGRGVYYHGSLPAAEMPGVFSRYHAALIPLKTNIPGAVPSKIFNAIANGLPVLFSADGEGAAIVREHHIGFANTAGDYDALRENIMQLVSMAPGDYETLRSRCQAAAAGPFNRQVQDDAFVAFVRQLLK